MKTTCPASFAVATCAFAILSVWSDASLAAEPLALNNGQMYLMLDPRLHGVGDACTLTVHPFQRYAGNPIIRPDPQWSHCAGRIFWDDNAQPIPGFTADIRMRDETRLPVQWAAARQADLKGKPVKIRFAMYDAELFAITCE